MAFFPRSFTYFLNATECGVRVGLEAMMKSWQFRALCSKSHLHLPTARRASEILFSHKNLMKFHEQKKTWNSTSHRICSTRWNRCWHSTDLKAFPIYKGDWKEVGALQFVTQAYSHQWKIWVRSPLTLQHRTETPISDFWLNQADSSNGVSEKPKKWFIVMRWMTHFHS